MPRWLGLDIGATTVRVALLHSTYRKIEVEALREERLGDHETPSAAIRVATVGLRMDAIATALSGLKGFVRQVALPAAAQRELSSVLPFEVEATLPMELEDAVMDHRVLRPVPAMDAPKTLPILAAVAYTGEVRDRISVVLRGAGQEPQRVGVGPLSLANLAQVIPALGRDEPVAILDLEEEHADVLIMHGGEPRFTRALMRGTRGLPEDAPALGFDLRQTMAAWRTLGGRPIQNIYVIGAGRDTPGIDAYFSGELDLTIADLPKPSLDGMTPEQVTSLPRFAKAISLALGLSRRPADLNLRQGPIATQQSYQFVRDKIPLVAGLFAALLVSFGFSVFAEMRALDAERQSLERQLELATDASFGRSAKSLEEATQMLEDAIGGKTDNPMPELDAFDVLVELSQRLPPADKLVHDIAELDYNRGAVKIQGVVPSIDDAHLVAAGLGEHPCFQNVNITRTTKLKQEDKHKYSLEFAVKCGGDGKTKGKAKGKSETKSPAKGAEGDKPALPGSERGGQE